MASKKKSDGSGIQQAAGLFDILTKNLRMLGKSLLSKFMRHVLELEHSSTLSIKASSLGLWACSESKLHWLYHYNPVLFLCHTLSHLHSSAHISRSTNHFLLPFFMKNKFVS